MEHVLVHVQHFTYNVPLIMFLVVLVLMDRLLMKRMDVVYIPRTVQVRSGYEILICTNLNDIINKTITSIFINNEILLLHLEPDPCTLPPYKGPCNGRILRYFYNTTSQKCEQFYYGGCLANENNFYSLSVCEEKCSSKFLLQVDVDSVLIILS